MKYSNNLAWNSSKKRLHGIKLLFRFKLVLVYPLEDRIDPLIDIIIVIAHGQVNIVQSVIHVIVIFHYLTFVIVGNGTHSQLHFPIKRLYLCVIFSWNIINERINIFLLFINLLINLRTNLLNIPFVCGLSGICHLSQYNKIWEQCP